MVLARLEIKLKKIRKSKRIAKWNREVLLSPSEKERLKNSLDNEVLEYKGNIDEDFNQWKKLQSSVAKVAEEVCGRIKYTKMQSWLTSAILGRMSERSKLKQQSNMRDEYKELCREIKRQCRQAKEHYYNNLCEELEDLDKKHNAKLYA